MPSFREKNFIIGILLVIASLFPLFMFTLIIFELLSAASIFDTVGYFILSILFFVVFLSYFISGYLMSILNSFWGIVCITPGLIINIGLISESKQINATVIIFLIFPIVIIFASIYIITFLNIIKKKKE